VLQVCTSHSPFLLGELVHALSRVILSFMLDQYSSFYYSRLSQSRFDSNCPFLQLKVTILYEFHLEMFAAFQTTVSIVDQ